MAREFFKRGLSPERAGELRIAGRCFVAAADLVGLDTAALQPELQSRWTIPKAMEHGGNT
jgi:hypothetical protein